LKQSKVQIAKLSNDIESVQQEALTITKEVSRAHKTKAMQDMKQKMPLNQKKALNIKVSETTQTKLKQSKVLIAKLPTVQPKALKITKKVPTHVHEIKAMQDRKQKTPLNQKMKGIQKKQPKLEGIQSEQVKLEQKKEELIQNQNVVYNTTGVLEVDMKIVEDMQNKADDLRLKLKEQDTDNDMKNILEEMDKLAKSIFENLRNRNKAIQIQLKSGQIKSEDCKKILNEQLDNLVSIMTL